MRRHLAECVGVGNVLGQIGGQPGFDHGHALLGQRRQTRLAPPGFFRKFGHAAQSNQQDDEQAATRRTKNHTQGAIEKTQADGMQGFTQQGPKNRDRQNRCDKQQNPTAGDLPEGHCQIRRQQLRADLFAPFARHEEGDDPRAQRQDFADHAPPRPKQNRSAQDGKNGVVKTCHRHASLVTASRGHT